LGERPGSRHGSHGYLQLINQNGAQVGGIYNLNTPSTPPHWLSYVGVVDCEKATAAAKAAGARILNGPMEVRRGSWITMMMDPQGGAFAVVEPPKAAAQKAAAKAKKPKTAAKADTPAAATPPAPEPKAAKKPAGKAAAKKGKAPAKKAPAKKAVAKKAARKAVKKAVKKVAKKAVKKAAKKAVKKVAKKAAGKAVKKGPVAKRAGGQEHQRQTG